MTRTNNLEDVGYLARINFIIESSFGKRFYGDWSLGVPLWGELGDLEKRRNKPFLIAKKSLFGIIEKVAGQLGTDIGKPTDGSVIVVLPKYREAGQRYAQLYKKTFGNNATVIVESSLRPSFDFGFNPLMSI